MSGRLWALATLGCLAGCCGTGSRSEFFSGKPPCDRCGPNNVPPPGVRIAPYPTDPPRAPLPPAPYLPPTPTPIPAASPTQLPPYSPPPAVGESTGPVGMNDPYVRPALDAQVRLDGPQKFTPDPATAQTRLDVPVPVQTDAKLPAAPVPAAPNRSSRAETQEPPPVDIPGYVVVRGQVANGQQPFPDGIAWLKTKGYRTVLHLPPPARTAPPPAANSRNAACNTSASKSRRGADEGPRRAVRPHRRRPNESAAVRLRPRRCPDGEPLVPALPPEWHG